MRKREDSVQLLDKLFSFFFFMIFGWKMQEPITYPFSAIVSMEDLKLALILNAVNPKIGGLLIRGSKGSGKTTAVRALAQVLPNIKVVKSCQFNCSPDDPSNMCDTCRSLYMKNGRLEFEERKMVVVELPLGASEDRVVGSLNVEKAIKMGVEALEPGVLAQANQNILYVDEINLLPDHIADDLLDAAAAGWNIVEREGISVKHPSRFILIGTMNPEEGHLRPQLLDRLSLSVEAPRISNAKDRIEVVRRNIEFEADPETFLKKYNAHQEELSNKIIQARKMLPEVKIDDKLVEIICKVCLELKVDGMRPDIIITKTAKTLAAFENKTHVTSEHVLKAAELTLSHRTREGGFLEPATREEIRETLNAKLKEAKSSESDANRTIDKVKEKKGKNEPPLPKEKKSIFPPFGLRRFSGKEKDIGKARRLEGEVTEDFLSESSSFRKGHFLFDSKPEKGGVSAAFSATTKWPNPKVTKGAAFIDEIRESRLPSLRFLFGAKKASKHIATDVGKRAESITAVQRGRARGWKIPDGRPSDIHFPATIRAAARMQRFRSAPSNIALSIIPEDIREKQRIYRAPMTIVFVLDLSESMLHCIDDVKEAMLRLHNDAYRYRDKVGLVAFKEMGAVVAQHPTANLKVVTNRLLRLRMSGFTPLAAGMQKALEVLREAKRRDPSTIPVMAIITDGDTNVPLRQDLLTGEVREFDALDVALFKYEDEAVKDVLSISDLIRKDEIYTVVVNAIPSSSASPASSGHITARMIAFATDGIYFEASGRITKGKELSSGEISELILQAQKNISHFHYMTHKTKAR